MSSIEQLQDSIGGEVVRTSVGYQTETHFANGYTHTGVDWRMPLPPLKGDVFHVIGFSNQDPLAGAPLELNKRLQGMPARGTGKQLVEVYFLDPLIARDPAAITEYGSYLSEFFYSDTALKLSKRFGIELPPAIATRTREQLPLGLGTSLISPFPD